MRIIPLIIVLTITSTVTLDAQRFDLMLVPFEENGKWGYLNFEDSIVVNPIFDEAYPTYGSRGRIKLKGKYGYINGKGEIIINPKFDTAEDFRYGIAKVTRRGKIKYINPSGKVNKQSIALCGGIYRQCLHPQDFIGIDTFKIGDKYRIRISKVIREDGKLNYYPDTLRSHFDNVSSIGRQYVVLERGDKKAILFDQKGYRSSEYIDSTLNFKYEDFMFFDCQGNETINHEIFGFQENNKWGFIKIFYQLEEIIEAKYFSISSMERGLALVEFERGKIGYVNRYGKEYFKRN